MQVLVTGAEGMLGRMVCDELTQKHISFVPADIIGDGARVDIADCESVFEVFDKYKPDYVINCAAMTNVDGCESQIDLAYKLNAVGPYNLACACESCGAILTQISTDYVFDGEKGESYTEFDVPNPTGVYGASKLAGESAIREVCPHHYIIRTSWMFAPHGKNFALTMLRLAENHSEIKVVNDQFGSPTYAKDLAEFVVFMQGSPMFGTYHYTNSGSCNWYEFACAVLKAAGKNVKVTPISTEEYGAPTKRPKYSVLANTKLPALRSWKEALKEYINNIN